MSKNNNITPYQRFLIICVTIVFIPVLLPYYTCKYIKMVTYDKIVENIKNNDDNSGNFVIVKKN